MEVPMDSIFYELAESGFSTEHFLMAGIFFVAAAMVLGWLGRLIFGKKNELGHAVSSAIGIMFIYIVTVVILMAGPELEMFREFLSPLPFISIEDQQLTLFIFETASFDQICTQILSMIILSFLVNLLDTLLPRGKSSLTWFLFRCATVVLSMGAHWITWQLLTAFLPDVIVTYASTILLGVLVVMLSVGAFKFIIGAAIATVNPIIGALYTFFFANLVGRQISKSVLTTTLLALMIWGLNYLGITTISIALAALMAYLPFLIVLVVVWYVINHIL
jgi:hypothetical protein